MFLFHYLLAYVCAACCMLYLLTYFAYCPGVRSHPQDDFSLEGADCMVGNKGTKALFTRHDGTVAPAHHARLAQHESPPFGGEPSHVAHTSALEALRDPQYVLRPVRGGDRVLDERHALACECWASLKVLERGNH